MPRRTFPITGCGQRCILNRAGARLAALSGCLGARRLKRDDAAASFLDEADRRAVASRWPFPVVQFLRREIDAKTLLGRATSEEKMIDARFYMALDELLDGRVDEARRNLLWIKDDGSRGNPLYPLVLSELEKLGPSRPAAGR